jgi:hypothetical protein
MGRARRQRTAVIAAASAVLHLVLLSALAIEATRPGAPLAPEETAIQVTLERPLVPILPPETKPLPAPRPASSLKPAPAPRLPAPVAAPPSPTAPHLAAAAATPSIDAGASAALGDLTRALRGSVGCSNPDAVSLTPAEREACRRRIHAGLEDAKPLSGLTAEKRARFDQVVHCHDLQSAAVPMPSATSNAAGGISGLGYVPSVRECPPGSR